MNRPFPRRRHSIAFTIVEMLVVIAIIALLLQLSFPAFSNAINRAKSLKCASNLRSIGIAATMAASDNNNQYPEIDQAGAPIYSPPGPTIVQALGPYGIITNTVQCPVDGTGGGSSFAKYGSSYEWDPVFDDEPINSTAVYITPTVVVPVSSGRVRLAMDFNPIHHGRPNVVYGDGHVSNH
ncbi:MAG: type II secretion system GspH family protein [Methylacidiphilales bacterium]|nr:type II secretion system GspH family protein [Candidatus Methylacidiphilales bacterium]